MVWINKHLNNYTLHYTNADRYTAKQVERFVNKAGQEIPLFFSAGFKKEFDVYIFPSRASLEEQWRKDWKLPDFKSECWMIASGVSQRLDLLSPNVWQTQACEHNPADSAELQQVILHELVHVYHAQLNSSDNFEGMEPLSWLIEGLATYASGQLTDEKLKEVEKSFSRGNTPGSLDSIWMGKLRYQQAGSLVRYIDLRFGRDLLISLLPLTSESSILKMLGMDERTLIHDWIEKPAGETYRMPGEWEMHEAVWVGWELFAPFNQPALNVIRALMPYVPVKVIAESSFSAQVAREYLHLQGVDSSKPAFHIMRDNRIWIRDHGAIFLTNEKKELGYADFNWTHYGIRDWLEWNTVNKNNIDETYRQVLKRTGSIDRLMGTVENAIRFTTDITMEGGSIEVNGKGVLILCEAVTLQRNRGKSKEHIESEFKRLLGVKKIIWMKQGLADDPHIIRPIIGKYIGFGTGGHTDEFVRFANENTILLAWVDEEEKEAHPINKLNYKRMKENLEILEGSTDQDGKPFTIIKVPLPDVISKKVAITNFQKNESDDGILASWLSRESGFRTGDTVYRVAAASYLNYLVTNGVVLLPEYSKQGSSPGKEARVKKIIAEAFPGRELIFIDVMSLNYEGGGIHCITQQEPSRK